MNYLDDYRKLIIEPLEIFKKDIIRKYVKSIFFKRQYSDLLDKIEVELINKYHRYYDMSVEDMNFKNILTNN